MADHDAAPRHVGLVEVHRDDERAAEEILRDAGRAMYMAKRAGRGNVCP
jgi:GGDEF domain-containing protein